MSDLQAYLAKRYGSSSSSNTNTNSKSSNSDYMEKKAKKKKKKSKTKDGVKVKKVNNFIIHTDESDVLPTASETARANTDDLAAERSLHALTEEVPAKKKSTFKPLYRKDDHTGSDDHRFADDADRSRATTLERKRAKMARGSDGSDESPPRVRRHDSDSSDDDGGDAAPRRGRGRASDRARHDSDSDSDNSPPRRARHDSDSDDESPPRRRRHDSDDDSDDDESPPRRRPRSSSDGDLSPPRRGARSLAVVASDDDSEDDANPETVHRDASGKKLDLREERMKRRLAKEKMEQKRAELSRWGKGLAQVDARTQRREYEEEQRDKSFARLSTDEDYNKHLREQIHAEDPMAEFMLNEREKERQHDKRGKKGGKDRRTFSRPVYQGSTPQPNRYGIAPGHRWDGIDRSNGFEKKLIQRQHARNITRETAHQWRTEDM